MVHSHGDDYFRPMSEIQRCWGFLDGLMWHSQTCVVNGQFPSFQVHFVSAEFDGVIFEGKFYARSMLKLCHCCGDWRGAINLWCTEESVTSLALYRCHDVESEAPWVRFKAWLS